jgi:hypothetical protein
VNVFDFNYVNRVLDARPNVLDFEIGIEIPDDFPKRKSLTYQFEDALHWNSGASNTGFSKMDIRINRNSFFQRPTSIAIIPLPGKRVNAYVRVTMPSIPLSHPPCGRRRRRAGRPD